jgi:hypothetical protein
MSKKDSKVSLPPFGMHDELMALLFGHELGLDSKLTDFLVITTNT